MVSQKKGPRLRLVRSSLILPRVRPVYPGKGPNENFGASKCYLGPNLWNLAPKGPTWQPWCAI